jgi:hypothetical protein
VLSRLVWHHAGLCISEKHRDLIHQATGIPQHLLLPEGVEEQPLLNDHTKRMLHRDADMAHGGVPRTLVCSPLANTCERAHEEWGHTVRGVPIKLEPTVLQRVSWVRSWLDSMHLDLLKQTALFQDTAVILWRPERACEVRNESVRDDYTLEFHPVAFFVPRVQKLLVGVRATHLPDGAIQETDDGTRRGTKRVQSSGVRAESVWGYKSMHIPVEDVAPRSVDICGRLVGDFRDR